MALPVPVAVAAARITMAAPAYAAGAVTAVALLTEKAPDEFPRLLVMWADRVDVAAKRHQGASIEIAHRLSNGAHREFRWNPDAVV